MKLYLLSLLALATAIQLSAQQKVLNSRLIAINNERYSSGAWNEQDSTYITYSGTRGGGMDDILESNYDVLQSWNWISGILSNYQLLESTFDANNNRLQTVTKHWVASAWRNVSRITFTYNAQGQATSSINETWDNNAWKGVTRYTYTRDANGNITVSQRDDWAGSSWAGYEKITYTYNSAGKQLEGTQQFFISGAWKNDTRYSFAYDASNNLELSLTEHWNTANSAWEPNFRALYTYNAAHKMLTQIQELYSGGAWTVANRTTNTYNAQNIRTENVYETYSSGAWQNSERYTYTPNSIGAITEEMRYNWNSGNWVQSLRYTRTFDGSGNNLTEILSYYNSGSSTWRDEYSYVRTYNSFNQELTAHHQENFGSGLQDNWRRYYYYETYEDGTSGIGQIPTLSSKVFPNPFSINVALEVAATQSGEHTFEVYNLAGQQVHLETRYWTAGVQTLVFDGQDLPKGVYFYKINSASGVASGKLVKQ